MFVLVFNIYILGQRLATFGLFQVLCMGCGCELGCCVIWRDNKTKVLLRAPNPKSSSVFGIRSCHLVGRPRRRLHRHPVILLPVAGRPRCGLPSPSSNPPPLLAHRPRQLCLLHKPCTMGYVVSSRLIWVTVSSLMTIVACKP